MEQYVCHHCSKVHRYSDGTIIDDRFYCTPCQERIAQESELAMRAYEDKVEEARKKGFGNKFCSETLQEAEQKVQKQKRRKFLFWDWDEIMGYFKRKGGI